MDEISVVIPVKNEASKIGACLDGILVQTVKVKEIIIIDSGSSDDTVTIIKKGYPRVNLVQIEPSEFNHGLTRQLGVSIATGDYVLFTVGDARPYNDRWIEELLAGFKDGSVDAVCGQQVVPHELDKNPVEWYRPVDKHSNIIKYHFKKTDEFDQLSPAEKLNICSWDDVNAMYKRSVLLEIPFKPTSYSEDAIWAKEAIRKNKSIVYNYNAKVYHYHLENHEFTLKRTLTTLYFRYKHFGFIPSKESTNNFNHVSVLKALIRSCTCNLKLIIKWYKYNLRLNAAIQEGTDLFNSFLKLGESYLDLKHSEICGKPPIPLKY